MGLRIRDIVAWVPTTEGILFRAGDSILPVEGHNIYDWFARLRPFLTGQWSADQLCSKLDEHQRKITFSVLKALSEADMLYEAQDDDPAVLPEAVRKAYVGSIRRIEAISKRPFREFAKFRRARLIILASSKIALALAQAGLEVGVGQQLLYVPDWNNESAVLLAKLLRSHGAEKLGSNIVHMDTAWEAAFAQLTGENEIVILAGEAHVDRERIEATAAVVVRAKVPLLTLTSFGGVAVVGPVEHTSTAACVRCLLTKYEKEISSPAPDVLDSGIEIGARLLMQRFLDCWTVTISADISAMCTEIDLFSLRISHRPFPLDSTCGFCREGTGVDTYKYEFEANNQSKELDDASILESAYKRLIDTRLGLIGQIEEGGLLQLPHHQSAALLRLPGELNRYIWITEIGNDALGARAAVMRRAVESYVTLNLAADSINCKLSFHSDAGFFVPKDHCQELSRGVVASGKSHDELIMQAFFKGIAAFAHQTSGWNEIPLREAAAGANLATTVGYLDDIGILNKVSIERHNQLRGSNWEILRFRCGMDAVAVIAGLSGSEMLATGFKDIWLHATSRDATFSHGGLSSAIRLRCIGIPKDMLLPTLRTFTRAFSLNFALAPISWPELNCLKPVVFAYGIILEDIAAHNFSNEVPVVQHEIA